MSFKSPAFQMYVNDFLGSAKVGMMDTEEIGTYLLLLFLDFQEKGFEYDSRLLAKWCRLSHRRFVKAWGIVGQCFVEKDGRMYNPRLELERIKQAEWSAKSAKGGLANAARFEKGGSQMVEPNREPKGSTPSPSPSPSPSPLTTTTSDSDESGAPKPKRTRPKSEPKYPGFPVADSQRLYQVCIKGGYVVEIPLLRKRLGPLYPTAGPVYSTDQIASALTAWLEARGAITPDKARFWTLREFAGDIGRWVRLGGMPLVDVNGVTERGRLAVGA